MTTPRSVYVIGGRGAGKSTFVQRLATQSDLTFGEYGVLHKVPKPRVNDLKGHQLVSRRTGELVGAYLGLNREEYPGTDALGLSAKPTAEAWLLTGELPRVIVGEGQRLTNTSFIDTLRVTTDMLLVYLWCPEAVWRERVASRSNTPGEAALTSPGKGALTVLHAMQEAGANVVEADTSLPNDWAATLATARGHISVF